MEYTITETGVVLNSGLSFDLVHTFECGQCFRWTQDENGVYSGIASGKELTLRKEGDNVILNCSGEDFNLLWKKYFDIDNDYNEIRKEITEVCPALRDAVNSINGIRILSQEPWEALCSFIISQNKQIPHIKKIVQDLSRKYGNYLGAINGEEFYSFPDVGQLGNIQIEDYRKCKTGFRAPYLFDAAMWIGGKENIGMELSDLGYETAKEKLKEIKGVGDKVANCVLLFSLGYRNSFPVDVWIKRIMEEMYFGKTTDNNKIMEFAKEKFGELGGYAQQYLFFYARENLKK